jgi:hypothetical protein
LVEIVRRPDHGVDGLVEPPTMSSRANSSGFNPRRAAALSEKKKGGRKPPSQKIGRPLRRWRDQ